MNRMSLPAFHKNRSLLLCFVNRKEKFIKELTLIGVVLTGLVAFVFHLFIPERYFLWFPAIPIFFYLFGLFYIYMFAFGYRLGLDKLASVYLLCKMMKFILSMLVLLFYGFFVRHEVVAFSLHLSSSSLRFWYSRPVSSFV